MLNPTASDHRKKSILIMAAAGVVILMLILYWLITAHQTRILRQQVFAVLPGSSQLQHLSYSTQTWQPVALNRANEDSLYAGYNEAGEFVGYAIPGEGPGYESPVRLLYGYLPDQRNISGLLVLESGETPGWGEQAFEDRGFLANFRSLAVDPKVVIVDEGEKDHPNEVDAMTGATITSQSIVQILNATNRRWLKLLPAAGSEPPLAAL